jgi:hypothetical protein
MKKLLKRILPLDIFPRINKNNYVPPKIKEPYRKSVFSNSKIDDVVKANLDKGNKDAKKAYDVFTKSTLGFKPNKPKGEKPKKPKYKKELGMEFRLYKGKQDKIRRVVRGGPRPPLQQGEIRYSLSNSVYGFFPGSSTMTSAIRTGVKADSDDWLFVTAFQHGLKSVLQIENLAKHEILDIFEMQRYSGLEGGRCLRCLNSYQIIGIFGDIVLTVDIVNESFENPRRMNVQDVVALDLCRETGDIILGFADKRVEIGEFVNGVWKKKKVVFQTYKKIFSAICYKNENEIILGLDSGRIRGYKQSNDDAFILDHIYKGYRFPVENMLFSRKYNCFVTSSLGRIQFYNNEGGMTDSYYLGASKRLSRSDLVNLSFG